MNNYDQELHKRGVQRNADGTITDDDGNVVGMKFDEGKIRYDLLPPGAVKGLAKIITFGAHKYGPENWKELESPRSRYFAACQRHLWAWFEGEKNDPDTGMSHLWHALCNVAFLAQLEIEGRL